MDSVFNANADVKLEVKDEVLLSKIDNPTCDAWAWNEIKEDEFSQSELNADDIPYAYAMSPTKRKYLRLDDKAKILESLDEGTAVTILAKKYGVAKSTICGIRNKRKQILKRVDGSVSGSGKRKTLKFSEYPKMEHALHKWYLMQRENQVPVTGLMIKEKAKSLQRKINETSCFNASSGWLQRFKKRYGVRLLKSSGEKSTAQPEPAEPFKEKLKQKINEMQLNLNQIYNADETGLYWKLLPDKMDDSIEKQRVTFLACTNATGSHKLKPLVVGKSKISLKNFNCPIHYKTAQMTLVIFKEWFHKMFIPEVKIFLENRNLPSKALLLLNNAPNRPPEEDLMSDDGCIIAMFMPANVIESADENLTTVTKLFYRKNLLLQVLAKNEDVGTALKELTLRDAISNLSLAWSKMEPKVVANCWQNLLPLTGNLGDNFTLNIVSSDAERTKSEISNLLHHINPNVTCSERDIEAWNEDDRLENDVDGEEDPARNEEFDLIEAKTICTSQALRSLNEVIQWVEDNEVNYSNLLALQDLRLKLVQRNLNEQQWESKVTSFFLPSASQKI